MIEGFSPKKPDEQYPLLMVSGAGDAGVRTSVPPTDPLTWNTTVTPKRTWSNRWPEYLSTCWMTFILLGISFLVFYAIGMVVIYRHEAYFIVKCNQTKPASDVFYHDLIQRGGPFPFNNYVDYLANVATMYTQLRFNVYFLIDDSKLSKYNFYEKIYLHNFYDEYNIYNRREVRLFQKKYPNVNITVMLLSKYMAMTPLKYKWRSIPTAYVPFYARIFAVWIHGGLGLDLVSCNQQYLSGNSRGSDWKARALLKLHNDGISYDKYIVTLKKIEHEEETEFVSSFFDMLQKMFNETYLILNKTFTSFSQFENVSTNMIEPLGPQPQSSALVRTHRNKRDIPAAQETKKDNLTIFKNGTASEDIVNIILANATVVNVTGESNKDNVYHVFANDQNVSEEHFDQNSIIEEYGWQFNKFLKENPNVTIKLPEITEPKLDVEKNKSDGPQIVLFYDISVISEPIRSDVDFQRSSVSSRGTTVKNTTRPPNFLTIGAEGSFIASTIHMHPFLGSILSAGCKHLPPKFAIQNALLTHCSGPFRDDVFCNSIYVL